MSLCCRDESDAFRSTAARRQELEKRAAEKAAAEARRQEQRGFMAANPEWADVEDDMM